MSNMGDMGDMGGGAGVPLPFRSDLPFDKEDAQLWRKDGATWKWIPATPAAADLEAQPALPVVWAPRDWSGKWSAWHILAEFATKPWQGIALTPYPTDAATLKIEKNALFAAAQDERADAIGEIVAQNGTYEDCIAYFGGLLRFTSRTHGKTFRLMHVAGLVGILTSMHFEAVFPPRPRPSQIWPALLPPIEVPGHPAFPSGHATQAMLMALTLEKVLKGTTRALATPLLHTLAHRIARNREITGLHYASDSRGGFELAGEAFALLEQCPLFITALADASAEWKTAP